MQQPTRLISTPFAQEGDKTEIQNVTGEFDNSATYRHGFPPITMQSIRTGGKPPKGTDFNGVLFDITENISFLCKGGRYQYNAGLSTLIGGYPEDSNLLLDDNVTEVVSIIAGNQNNPNTDMTGWILKPNRTTAEYVADASGETQQQVNYNGGSKWYSRVGGYLKNKRVVLTNGDIVKSTIDGNTNNPNSDMTGWVYSSLTPSKNLSDVADEAAARTNLGLGTAAVATLTTSNQDNTVGRVLKVGDYGLGAFTINTPDISGNTPSQTPGGFVRRGTGGYLSIPTSSIYSDNKILLGKSNGQLVYLQNSPINTYVFSEYLIRTGKNTAVDANGFIKNASPIVKLYADKIETNDEAQQQNITFEKLGVGDYLIKGSSGFAQDSWYIEMPKDANGNVLVAVVYEQLENGDISVKTYAKKFDEETGDIVANLTRPRDIPDTRWIDLRLQELPQHEVMDGTT